MKNQKIFLFLFMLIWSSNSFGQEITQDIRGTIIDKDSKAPLIGVSLAITNIEPTKGTSTDIHGNFILKNIPIGRINLQASYIGYETSNMNGLLLTSGKELVLNIEILESTSQLVEIVVVDKLDKTKAINELSTVSARSFSVEETARYAAGNFDPARMAQSYAGVSVGGSTSDLFNEIVIRGNSPRGVLWRLEGIEIPNPNHFSDLGGSGGAISMLSSSTLTNSDFYTGAFPSEFGNALSGVFDLSMRIGNNEKREYAVMLGALGIEVAAEGPFSKNSKASYLINYRYSTLAALEAIGLSPVDDVLPAYQDLSFKLNMPTAKAGVFSLFGLGGTNTASFDPKPDSTTWEVDDDRWGFVEKQKIGTIGVSHKILLSNKSYLRTVAIASNDNYIQDEYTLDKLNNYKKTIENEGIVKNTAIRLSSTYTKKFNAQHTIRGGLIFSHQNFRFKLDERKEETDVLTNYFDNSGGTPFMQAFLHWKYRLNDKLTLNSGLHYSQLFINNAKSIEPRAALKWQFSPKQTLSVAAGLHSKLEHIAVYIFEGEFVDGTIITPKKDLKLSKAMHAVLAYDHNFTNDIRLKAELYYQHLYDVPVNDIAGSRYSIINSTNIWETIGADSLNNSGTGRNYGIDLTFEKFFSNQYYFMVTGSLYESKFTPANDVEYNTRFNGNYQLNLLVGKEFKVGKRKKNIFGINGKIVLSGGNRFTPIDLEASKLEGEEVLFEDRTFEDWGGQYYRFDLGLSYKINSKKMTHTIMVDIQNLTNHKNVYRPYYDEDTNSLEKWYQTGIFPTFNYRIEF